MTSESSFITLALECSVCKSPIIARHNGAKYQITPCRKCVEEYASEILKKIIKSEIKKDG